MIVMILVGVFALVRRRVRVTHSFTISGDRAKQFGLVLVIGAIPYTLLVRAVAPYIIPSGILRDPVMSRLLNVGILMLPLFAMAFAFRDSERKASEEPTPVAPDVPFDKPPH